MLGYPNYSSRQFRDTRKRYPSDEIARVWAYQQSENGRCPANMSFDGAEFSSYQTVVATIVTFNGHKAFALTQERYSQTTSAHMWQIRRGIPDGEKVFDVPDVSTDAHRILKTWSERIKSKVEEGIADGNYGYIREAEKMTAAMGEFADYFGISAKQFTTPIPSADKFLRGKRAAANKILARLRKSDPELHTALTIEAYKITVIMRNFARGAGIPIENYRVKLPMKEPDIKAAIALFRNAAPIREHIMNSRAAALPGDLFAALDTLKSLQATEAA